MLDLSIAEIKSPGDLESERLVIFANKDTRSGDYVVFSAKADEKGVYGGIGTAFWLANVNLTAGDNLVIYTKTGVLKTKDIDVTRKSHFLYLGQNAPLWKDGTRAAVLFYVGRDWTKARPGGFAQEADTEPL